MILQGLYLDHVSGLFVHIWIKRYDSLNMEKVKQTRIRHIEEKSQKI